jgi:hypothetical protein
MMRKLLKTVLAVLIAGFTIGSIAEAAPRQVTHRRVRHSARVVHRVVRKPVKRVVHAARPAKRVVRHRTTKPR